VGIVTSVPKKNGPGPHRVAHGPGSGKIDAANRGAGLWGGFVISMANYPPRMIATNKETGKVVWETNLGDGQPGAIFSAASLPVPLLRSFFHL
jgi:hypothetical protein